MAVSWRKRRPILANDVGGLSGPAIKPLALHGLGGRSRCRELPVIGIGGIASVDDALEFLVAGRLRRSSRNRHLLRPDRLRPPRR